MNYIVPPMPAQPSSPSFFARKPEKEKYNTKMRIYSLLSKSHNELRNLHSQMEAVRRTINITSPDDCRQLEQDAQGLFKIICPYCLEKYEVSDLLYRARVREDANGDLMGCFEPETDEPYASFWERMGVNEIDSLRGHILDMRPEAGEIRSITFEVNAVGGKETLPYTADSKEQMKAQKVLKMEDKYGNDVTERICPKCHTQLPGDIGFCPNYIYSLMGNSSCGKTIYLNRIILTLTSGQFLNGNLFGIGANDEMAALGETAKEGAKKIFSITGQSLADATDVGYIPPFILRLQDTKTRERFFITLFDYPGEAIWKDDDAFFQPLAERVRKNSNGLLFMFDSGVTLDEYLPDEYKVFNNSNGSTEENDPAKATAEEIISRIYTHTFKGNPVDKPVALVMSKSDLIKVCMDRLTGGIWRSSPNFLKPISPHKQIDLTEMYRNHCDVQDFLNAKEKGATSVANAMCNGNHSWFALSSTSIPLENGTIPEGAVVAGLHETDPLEWLLYRNGHLSARFNDKDENAPDAKRWAAGFQVEAFYRLENIEKKWNGDSDDDSCRGEINVFESYRNQFESI